jgi:GT2 family glycosyltransferase
MLRMHLLAPMKVVDVELAQPLVVDWGADGRGRHTAALVLVRLHREPLGTVCVSLQDGEVEPASLGEAIRRELAPRIARHLEADGATGEVRFTDEGALDAPRECRRTSPRDTWTPATVIVCTRDRPRELSVCIESLLRMTHEHFDVVVVDSAPTSAATKETVERYAGERISVRYVRENEPGLARARNRGVTVATGAHLAFTDDDVRVDAAWLSELTAALDPGVACATGLSLPAELETRPQVWFEEFGGFGKGYDRRVFDRDSHRHIEPLYPYKVGWFGSGLNMAFEANALRALGGFDERLGAGTRVQGGEDLDAFLRVIAGGGRLVYEPRALVWHYHRRDVEALRRQLHGSGAGLSAVLLKRVLDPATRRDVLTRAWEGFRYLLAPSSPKNQGKSRGYPRSLTLAELTGVAAGPFLYAASLRRDARS